MEKLLEKQNRFKWLTLTQQTLTLSLELMINFALDFQKLYNVEEFRSLYVFLLNIGLLLRTNKNIRHQMMAFTRQWLITLHCVACTCKKRQKCAKNGQNKTQVINWHCFVTIHQNRGRQWLTSTVIHTVILRILSHFLKNFWEPFLNKKAWCQRDLNQGSLAWESSALTIQPTWHVNKLTPKFLFKVKFEKLKNLRNTQ